MNSEDLSVTSVKDREALPIAQEIGQSFDGDEMPARPGMNFYDLLFILFRHKRLSPLR